MHLLVQIINNKLSNCIWPTVALDQQLQI